MDYAPPPLGEVPEVEHLIGAFTIADDDPVNDRSNFLRMELKGPNDLDIFNGTEVLLTYLGGDVRVYTDVLGTPGAPLWTPNLVNSVLTGLTLPTTLWVEALEPSDSTRDIGFRLSLANPSPAEQGMTADTISATALQADMVTDWNRDGVIDDQDRGKVTAATPWRFWINDDEDETDIEGFANDKPDSSNPNHANCRVDGNRDLVDFFPVYLDVSNLKKVLGDLTDYSFALRHSEGALNFAYTTLTPEEVGNIHTTPNTGLEDDSVFPATFTFLNSSFVSQLDTNEGGVLLLEGKSATTAPLVLEVYEDQGLGGSELIYKHEFPLSLSPVRDMLRIINIRGDTTDPKFNGSDVGPWISSVGNPSNYSDGYYSDGASIKTLINIHGLGWSGADAPGGHAEIFKRFFQMGSDARFIGVTWYSDAGNVGPIPLDYNENVIHAFIAANYVSNLIKTNGLDGQNTSIFAHSLGNMLTSSMIVDFDLNVGNYFMINAAVPVEAYAGMQGNHELMTHPDWKGHPSGINYFDKLLAPYWHEQIKLVYGASDNRVHLKWEDRFSSLPSKVNAYNFYSSGEEVLAQSDGEVPSLLDITWSGIFGEPTELVWVYNEMNKGIINPNTAITNDIHGGWGFNTNYTPVPLQPFDANQLTATEIVATPFFNPFQQTDSEFPLWGNVDTWIYANTATANTKLPSLPLLGKNIALIKNHAKILAEAIPAHSDATGSSSLEVILGDLGDFDLNSEMINGSVWPRTNNRWLHGDLQGVALSYNYLLYAKCIELGDLDQ